MRRLLVTLVSLFFVTHAWAASPVQATQATASFVANQTTGVGYLTLKNTGAKPVIVTQITSNCCASVEMHEMSMQGDIMRMRRLPTLTIGAGETALFTAGENHIMFIDLKHRLSEGDTIATTIHFADGSHLPVNFKVESKGNP